MLKLVSAYDVNYYSAKEYRDSYTDNCLGEYPLLRYNLGADKYFKDLKEHYRENVERLYYLIDEEYPKYIIGYGTLEISDICNYHFSYLNEGHISYGIRPNERGKGYGNELLRLLLDEAEEIGMKEVCISCYEDNKASRKIIENNDGIFETEWFNDWNGKKAYKYWIKLNPTIKNKIKRIQWLKKNSIHDKI